MKVDISVCEGEERGQQCAMGRVDGWIMGACFLTSCPFGFQMPSAPRIPGSLTILGRGSFPMI